MKLKRFSVLFALVLAFSTFFSSFAFASDNTKPNLVALGDSITYGYNLDPGNALPSQSAFPNLIGGTGAFNVANLGVPALTSTDLLTRPELLNNGNPGAALKAALQQADVITLNIGSNDLLQANGVKAIIDNPPVLLTENNVALDAALADALKGATNLANNLPKILAVIRTVNTKAPIILYNIYNPFGVSENPVLASLHQLGEMLIPGLNESVINRYDGGNGTFLADAYTAFNGHQAEFVLPMDVHPTKLGHHVLADLATGILATIPPADQDLTVSLTSTPGENTNGPVTIKVGTSAINVQSVKWLSGEKTIGDFASAGTDVKDLSFQVTENDKYTVYVQDNEGKEAVATIEVKNIIKDQPTDKNPTQTQTPAQSNTTTPSSAAAATGHALPDTATPMFNYLAIGLVVVLLGLSAMKLQQVRRKED